MRRGFDAVEDVKRHHGVLVLVLAKVTLGVENCGDDAATDDIDIDDDDNDGGGGGGDKDTVGLCSKESEQMRMC